MTNAQLLTVDELTAEVTERAGRLEGPAEAVAVLESIGVTDEQARMLGRSDVFQLGYEVFEHQGEDPQAHAMRNAVETRRTEIEQEKRKPTQLLAFVPRFFVKGLTFGAPMVIMLLSVLVLLYSLWAYYYFDIPRGSAIGVGIVGSYLVTAGFMQAIGRRGLMYLQQDMQILSLKVSLMLVALGVILTVVMSAVLWLFLELFPVVAASETKYAVMYFFTLSLLWLGLAIVYMLQQEFFFSLIVALGIAVVYFLREYSGTSIIFAHQMGILVSAALGFIFGIVNLLVRESRLKRKRKQQVAGKLPRLSVIVYSVAPYFLYGFIYFAFLFTDRVMAWTGRTGFRQSFVWFQSDYEVGLNGALVSLIFSLGILEFAVYRLGELVPYFSHVFSIIEIQRFTRRIASFYRKAVLAYLVSAVVGVIFVVLLSRILIPRIPLIATLINDVSVYVFFVASVSYLLIVWGLLNNAFMFAFSRPRFALTAVVPALAVDVVVGFLCSRLFVYWAACFGLLAGAIVYWALTTFYVARMLRDMDYYAYSAF